MTTGARPAAEVHGQGVPEPRVRSATRQPKVTTIHEMTDLAELEAEAVHILRDVVAAVEIPASSLSHLAWGGPGGTPVRLRALGWSFDTQATASTHRHIVLVSTGVRLVVRCV